MKTDLQSCESAHDWLSNLPSILRFFSEDVVIADAELETELLSMTEVPKLLGKARSNFVRILPQNTTLRVAKWGGVVRRLKGCGYGAVSIRVRDELENNIVVQMDTTVLAAIRKPADGVDSFCRIDRYVGASIEFEILAKIISAGKATSPEVVLSELARIMKLMSREAKIAETLLEDVMRWSTVRPIPTVIPFFGGGLVIRSVDTGCVDIDRLDAGMEWIDWHSMPSNLRSVAENWSVRFLNPDMWNPSYDPALMASLTLQDNNS